MYSIASPLVEKSLGIPSEVPISPGPVERNKGAGDQEHKGPWIKYYLTSIDAGVMCIHGMYLGAYQEFSLVRPSSAQPPGCKERLIN